MSDLIERPTFYEGQVLAPGDLEAGVGYARGQLARHERYLHTWGIATGLTLTGKKKTTTKNVPYQEVTLAAGVAIDGSGREIVVPEPVLLSRDDFKQSNVIIREDPANPANYPVFLNGLDASAPPPAFATAGDCAGGRSSRFVEKYEIRFGRPGDEIELDTQTAPAVADGPGAGGNTRPWRLLLGFVQWNGDIDNFKDVSPEAGGVGPRYAGTLADAVAARAGKLLLRTQPESEAQKPALVLDEEDGGELKFGMLNSLGVVTPVFTVTSKGDIFAEGTLKAKFATGSVQVQSGIAMDGLLLPLPPGVTQEMIDAGKVILHLHVTARIPDTRPATWAADAFPVVLECLVDADRRVRCRIRWVRLTGGPPATEDRVGQCDYTVLAVVPAASGS